MGFLRRMPVAILAIGIVYFILARLGLQFATINNRASPVWPVTGFAIGMMIVLGPRYWLGIYLGATAANLMQGGPWVTAFLIGVGNTLEALAGAYLYRQLIKSETRYGPLVEAWAIFASSVVASAVSATIGVVALLAFGTLDFALMRQVWITWWSGDAIGGLFFIPLVLAARHGFRETRWLASIQVVLGTGASILLIRYGDGTWYLCAATLLVIAMSSGRGRLDPTLAAILVAFVGIGASSFGYGPFRFGSTNDNLLNLQLYLSSIAVTVLFLKAFARLGPMRVPGTVLAVGCILGAAITYSFVNRAEAADELRTDRIITENTLSIEERLDAYEHVVSGAVALLGVLENGAAPQSSESWARYVAGLDLKEQYPGMLGLGLIETKQDGRRVVLSFAPNTSDAPMVGAELSKNSAYLFAKAPESLQRRSERAFAAVSLPTFFQAIPYFWSEEMAFELRQEGITSSPLFLSSSVMLGREVREVPLVIADQRFKMRWYRLPGFISGHDSTIAWVSTAISLIALALAAFVANLQAVRLRVEELARSMAKMSALGEMAGGIAHEINNPLTVIGVTTSQLARDVEASQFDKEAMLKKVERIDRTTKRIVSIVQGLRVFSRSSDSVQKQAVVIQDVVSNVTDLCLDRFRHHGVELRILGKLDVEVHASIVQIEQVLLNLLSNAFDAVQTVSVKWVSLDVEVDEREVRLIVQDSGGRIPESVAQKMMEPFYTTKELGKGTGLGLSISKGILASHGGQLVYDASRPHTCFVMVLPHLSGQGRAA